MLTITQFEKIIEIMSAQEKVKKDVAKNYANNLWWPLDITDYKIRLLIAGLSTRISYNMINTYRDVIYKINRFGYEEFKKLSETTIKELIKPLGLANNRYLYIRSMMEYIDENKKTLLNKEDTKIIYEISANVYGASYKVAQCCVVYIRSYNCEIIPVDSGMKDLLLPCIGLEFNQKGLVANENARIELTKLGNEIDLLKIINQNGYSQIIKKTEDSLLLWWLHLVLIYFKRNFCNNHKPEVCPLNINCLSCKQKCLRKK